MINFVNKYCTSMPIKTLQDALKDSGLKIVHFFSKTDNMGGVTVCYRPDTEFKNCKMVEVAVSYCSIKDQFNKRIGTDKAINNFVKGCTVKVPARGLSDQFTVAMLRSSFYSSYLHTH